MLTILRAAVNFIILVILLSPLECIVAETTVVIENHLTTGKTVVVVCIQIYNESPFTMTTAPDETTTVKISRGLCKGEFANKTVNLCEDSDDSQISSEKGKCLIKASDDGFYRWSNKAWEKLLPPPPPPPRGTDIPKPPPHGDDGSPTNKPKPPRGGDDGRPTNKPKKPPRGGDGKQRQWESWLDFLLHHLPRIQVDLIPFPKNLFPPKQTPKNRGRSKQTHQGLGW